MPAVLLFQAMLATLEYPASGRRLPILGEHAAHPGGRQRWLAAECGVYRGHALVAYAQLARRAGLPVHLYGLDTFRGFPSPSADDKAVIATTAGGEPDMLFADTSLEEVQHRLDAAGVAECVTLVPGMFETTLSGLPDGPYFFVSIDCDLYEPHLVCLEHFYPRMMRGGAIYFDDYHSEEFPMARKAIDEFLRGRTEQLFHVRYGEDGRNHTKAFLIKF